MTGGQVHAATHRKASVMNLISITPRAASPVSRGRTPVRTNARRGLGDIDVLIADDRRGVSYSVWALLTWKEGIRLIANVQSGEEALRVARERKPCVCLVSATLLARDGLELAHQLKHLGDPPRVLIYADSIDERLAASAVIAEADGVVWRYQDPEETAAAIRRVASGQQNFPTLARDGFAQLAASLDDRDRAIVALLLDNAHPDDIASTLGLSARLLRERRQAIRKRLGRRHRDEQQRHGHGAGPDRQAAVGPERRSGSWAVGVLRGFDADRPGEVAAKVVGVGADADLGGAVEGLAADDLHMVTDADVLGGEVVQHRRVRVRDADDRRCVAWLEVGEAGGRAFVDLEVAVGDRVAVGI
jgi:two-component system response regulator DesR